MSPEVHLRRIREVSLAAYLRVALTYMLISMPHGTSTIFGAFQAILALLAKRDETSVLVIKLPCDEKFASEIFYYDLQQILLRCKIDLWLGRQTGSGSITSPLRSATGTPAA